MLGIAHTMVYVLYIAIGGYASYLMYTGLSTESDTVLGRLELKQFKEKTITLLRENNEESMLAQMLEKAGNPLGLTALKYNSIYYGVLLVLISAYIITPVLQGKDFNVYIVVSVILVGVFMHPEMKFSLIRYILKKLEEMQQIKLQGEVFTLYDLILGEVRMMEYGRVNTFSIIRSLTPEFDKLRPSLSMLLMNWNRDGAENALEEWAEEVGTKEASALASVLKELDNNDISVAISSLVGQQKMFLTQNIENFRRKVKLKADIAKMPVMATFAVIMANFLSIIVIMSLDMINNTMSF